MVNVGRTRRQRSLVFGFIAVLISVAPASARQPRRPHAAHLQFIQVTRASWYGHEFAGQRTAGGRPFRPDRLTAAHPTLDIGSKVKVTELRSGRSVIVEINDRGPFAPGRGIDLSLAAAGQLGMVQRGVAWVRIEQVIEEPPTNTAPPVVAVSMRPTMSWLPKAIVE